MLLLDDVLIKKKLTLNLLPHKSYFFKLVGHKKKLFILELRLVTYNPGDPARSFYLSAKRLPPLSVLSENPVTHFSSGAFYEITNHRHRSSIEAHVLFLEGKHKTE